MIYRVRLTVGYSDAAYDFDKSSDAMDFLLDLTVNKSNEVEGEKKYRAWLEIVIREEEDF